MYKHKSLKGRSTTTKVSVFLQNFLNFIITKYLKQEIDDGQSVCLDEYSPCGVVKIYHCHVIKR